MKQFLTSWLAGRADSRGNATAADSSTASSSAAPRKAAGGEVIMHRGSSVAVSPTLPSLEGDTEVRFNLG